MVLMLFVTKRVLYQRQKFQHSILEEIESVQNLDSTFPVMAMKAASSVSLVAAEEYNRPALSLSLVAAEEYDRPALSLLLVAAEEYSRPLTEAPASEVVLLVSWVTRAVLL